jgi:2-haloalkanoic acid dehalogenase type II
LNALHNILPRVTTITFDCYGTLIDWDRGLRQSLGELFDGVPASGPGEFFRRYVETEAQVEAQAQVGDFRSYRDVLTETATRLAKRFSISLPPGRAATFAGTLPDWTPFSDTNDALARLKRKYRLGILSNVDRDLFDGTAEHFTTEFDFVITAQDVRSYKPNKAHFDRLLADHSTPEATLHVAQSLFHDGVPAGDLGLAFVWINRYNESPAGAIPMVAQFHDLKSLADEVCRQS